MRRTDAIGLFAELMSLFPTAPQLTPDAQAYWVAMIERLPESVAKATAGAVVNECKFFPSIAEWQEQARIAYAQHHHEPAALPAPPADLMPSQSQRQAAAEWIPKIRETIRNAQKPSSVRGMTSLAESLAEPF